MTVEMGRRTSTAAAAPRGRRRVHPNRFGFFAYLPLTYVDAALAEARYALDVLGRLDEDAGFPPAAVAAAPRRFYYDTALLFGTDWNQNNRDNALRLLPRFQ